MSHTNHNQFKTHSPISFSDVAKWLFATFPAAVLLAVTFFPETALPWFVRLMEAMK